MIQKSNMHVDGKSDGRAVPTKCPNKSGNPLAEGAEGSRAAKENTEQTTTSQTQTGKFLVLRKTIHKRLSAK